MEVLNKIRDIINNMLSEKYSTKEIRGQTFFVSNDGTPFHIVNLSPFRDALVIEYADTWEDGDLFYITDYPDADSMFAAMVDEIEHYACGND